MKQSWKALGVENETGMMTPLLGQRLLEVDQRMHEVQSGDSMTVERRDACHHAPLDQSLDDGRGKSRGGIRGPSLRRKMGTERKENCARSMQRRLKTTMCLQRHDHEANLRHRGVHRCRADLSKAHQHRATDCRDHHASDHRRNS